MAVANPCLQKELSECKRDMKERRGKRWRERISCWVKADVSDKEEDIEVEEEGEGVDSKEEHVNEEENEVGENGEEEDKAKTAVMRKAGETEEEKVESDSEMGLIMENGDEEEDRRTTEADKRLALEEEEKVVENEVDWEDNRNHEVDETKEKQTKESEEVQREVREDVDGKEETEAKERENEDEEGEKETTETTETEEMQFKEGGNEEEELQEQKQIGRYSPEETFREWNMNIQEIQDSTRRHEDEDPILGAGDSIKNEDPDFIESENEYFNEMENLNENSYRHENLLSETWTTPERDEEDEGERLTDEEETVTEFWTTQEDHEHHQDEEEKSVDDEDAETSVDEDGDYSDEDDIKVYFKDDYPKNVFLNLNKLRDSSLLTDLTLRTEDRTSFSVHSPVLAAVSSLILDNLNRSKGEINRADERKDDATCVGAHRWSVSLAPEVDCAGLEAIVEFAYTGQISCLSNVNADNIKAAARAMGVPRVLNLCTEEEEKSTKTGGQEKKKKCISAAQQMMISLQSIKQLWLDRLGCDVILEACGGSLHVHRVILAVSSDYFRGMFTLGMRECHQPQVTLPFLSASELEILIGCSYSGTLPMSWEYIFEITSTALQLQYQPALSLCFNFLYQEMTPQSCLDVVSFAEAYEITQLLEAADDFVLRHFQKVACTSKFKDLSAKQLLKYLNSYSLCVPSELVVFKAVVAWIQAKPKLRFRLAKELMKTVQFPLMTFKEFKEVQSQTMWSNPNMAELYEKVLEDFCSSETALQNQCRIYLPKESLVLIGGDQISEDLGSRRISRELWFGNSLRNHTGIKKAMEWRRLGEMPEPARFSHEVAVLKGKLYVFGGKKYYGIGDTLNSVYRYDPRENSWECLAEMQEKRCSFSVVLLEENIYAIGGHCDPDSIDSVERYCPSTNSWSFTCPLDLPLSGHVAKVTHGQIFISGGRNSDHLCLASMFCYHPETGSTYLANMTTPRAHHCMEALGECLYVAGGVTTDVNMTVVDQLACEVYNPATDFWTTFTSLPVPHVGAGSAVLEGKFYVLGGYSQEDYTDTKMVHRYDAITQRWENMGKMPGPNNDIRASLLCLPMHFRL